MQLDQKHIKHNIKLLDKLYFMIVHKVNKTKIYVMIISLLLFKIIIKDIMISKA